MSSVIKVDTIQSAAGSTILGQTNSTTITLGVTGQTITVPSGVSLSGNITNTPTFMAVQGSDQSIAYNTWTKCQLSSVKYDTASAFDNTTNYRWTVPSGADGLYNFVFNGYLYYVDANERVEVRIYKNGSNAGSGSTEGSSTFRFQGGASNTEVNMVGAWSDELIAGDYIELYALHTNSAGNQTLDRSTYLMGYKVIGA